MKRLALILLLSLPSWATVPAFVQAATPAAAATTIAITGTTAHNTLIVIGAGCSTSSTTRWVTDTQGNLWYQAPRVYGGHYTSPCMWYAPNIVGGNDTVNVSPTGSGPSWDGNQVLGLLEYSGIVSVSLLDGYGSDIKQDSVSQTTTASVTTLTADVLLLAIGGPSNTGTSATLTASAGFNLRSSSASGYQFFAWDKVVSAAGTYTNTITTNQNGSNYTSNNLYALRADPPPAGAQAIQQVMAVSASQVGSPSSPAFYCSQAGNRIIAIEALEPQAGLGLNPTLYDNLNQTWDLVGSAYVLNGSNYSIVRVFEVRSCLTGANTVSYGIGTAHTHIEYLEISGVPLTYSPNFMWQTATSTSTASLATGNLVTTGTGIQISFGLDNTNGYNAGATPFTNSLGYPQIGAMLDANNTLYLWGQSNVAAGTYNATIGYTDGTSTDAVVGIIQYQPPPAPPTIGFLQDAVGFCQTAPCTTAVTATFPFPVRAGDFLEVGIINDRTCNVPSPGACDPSPLTDTQGNTYTLQVRGPNNDIQIYTAVAKNNGPNVVSATPPVSLSSWAVLAQEYASVGDTITASGTGGEQNTSPISASVTNTVANSMLLAVVNDYNAWNWITCGTGFNNRGSFTWGNPSQTVATCDRLVSSITGYTNAATVNLHSGGAVTNASQVLTGSGAAPSTKQPAMWIMSKKYVPEFVGAN